MSVSQELDEMLIEIGDIVSSTMPEFKTDIFLNQENDDFHKIFMDCVKNR